MNSTKTKVLARFSVDASYHEVEVDLSKFFKTSEYEDEVFGMYYDSMIAKLITIAQSREEAINTMERALSEFVVEGVKTTIPFHQQLMRNEEFRKGNYTTKFMESFKMQ